MEIRVHDVPEQYSYASTNDIVVSINGTPVDPATLFLFPPFHLPLNVTLAMQINIRIPNTEEFGPLRNRVLPLIHLDGTLRKLPTYAGRVVKEALLLRVGLLWGFFVVGVELCVMGIAVSLPALLGLMCLKF